VATLKWFFFGTPRVEYSGQSRKIDRRKALALAALLCTGDGPQSRDRLAGMLWPELSLERGRAALRATLPVLTALAAEPWLEADRQNIWLEPQRVWSDTRAFLAVPQQTRQHRHPPGELCQSCVHGLEEVVKLYQRDFLEDFSLQVPEFEEWAAVQREWFRRELVGMLHGLGEFYAHQGRFEQAITCARRGVELEPFNETVQRLLMRLLVASGQEAQALRQYKAHAALLAAEFSAQPEEETTRLYTELQAGYAARYGPGSAYGPNGAYASPGGDAATLQTQRAAAEPVAVLPHLPPLLVGREAELTDLKRRLGVGGERQAVTVLEGWPGVGKSTVAAVLCHDGEVAQAFPDGVLWVSLGETPDLAAKLALWANALHLSDPTRNRTPEELTYQLRAALREKRVLLVVDDVWQTEDAAFFWVGGKACATLLTTQLGPVALELVPTARDIYRLGVLDEGRGLELLERISPETVRDHPKAARELVGRLEGLPLALQVAGRLLQAEARLGGSVSDLLDELRQRVDPLEGAELPSSIAALLRRSTDGLDAPTRERFAALGVLPPKPSSFNQAALGALWDTRESKPALRALLGRGLLEAVGSGRFQLHNLLALHARALLQEYPAQDGILRQRYKEHYLGWLERQHRALLGAEQQQAIAAIGLELDHLCRAWLWAVEDGEGELLERVFFTLSVYLTHTGQLSLGAELFAPAAARRWPSTATHSYFTSVYGWVQILLGSAEGEARMRQGIEPLLQTHVQGARSALILACLGSWLTATGRLDEAETLFQQSLAALQAQSSPDSDWAGVQLEGFWASLELARGRFEAALARTEAALALAEAVQDGVQTSWVRSVQAQILLQKGQTAQAEALVKANWRYFRAVDNRWGAVNALKLLGLLTAQRGEIGEALDYLQEALETVAQVGDYALRQEIAGHIARLRVSG